MSLSIQPMQWDALLLHEAHALDESDAACLDDLQHVLGRYRRLQAGMTRVGKDDRLPRFFARLMASVYPRGFPEVEKIFRPS